MNRQTRGELINPILNGSDAKAYKDDISALHGAHWKKEITTITEKYALNAKTIIQDIEACMQADTIEAIRG